MAERKYRIKNFGSELKLRYGLEGVLSAGEMVLDRGLTIGYISNGRLLPKRFELRRRDNNPIMVHNERDEVVYRLDYPGKSAFFLFDDDIDRRVVGEMVEVTLNRPIDRRDKLHTATVGAINSAGWETCWAPLPNGNFLHARLVPGSVLSGGTFNIDEAVLLCSVFTKVC